MNFNGIKNLGKVVEKFVKENGPTLLMSAGLVSFGGAIYATGVATVKSTKDVIEYNEEETEELTPNEIVKREWKNYIPAAGLTAAGTTAIICANHMNLVRIETLATAYALNKDKFEEYQNKVKEILGDKKETKIRDEIAKDHAQNDNPPWMSQQLLENEQTDLVEVRDTWTGVRFKSTAQQIDNAVNEFNKYLIVDEKEDLNCFYDILGLENTKAGEAMVWTYEPDRGGSLMSIEKHYDIRDGKPVMVLEYKGDKSPFRSKQLD